MIFIHPLLALGESVSSDTSIGYNNEVEIALIPWQASEEDQEVNASTDVCVDPDAPRWLQLSPSDNANLTGITVQKLYFRFLFQKGVQFACLKKKNMFLGMLPSFVQNVLSKTRFKWTELKELR